MCYNLINGVFLGLITHLLRVGKYFFRKDIDFFSDFWSRLSRSHGTQLVTPGCMKRTQERPSRSNDGNVPGWRGVNLGKLSKYLDFKQFASLKVEGLTFFIFKFSWNCRRTRRLSWVGASTHYIASFFEKRHVELWYSPKMLSTAPEHWSWKTILFEVRPPGRCQCWWKKSGENPSGMYKTLQIQ